MNKQGALAGLEQAEQTYLDTIGAIASSVRRDIVVPFCEERGWRFVSGMGSWFFVTSNNDHAYRDDWLSINVGDQAFIEIHDLLETQIYGRFQLGHEIADVDASRD